MYTPPAAAPPVYTPASSSFVYTAPRSSTSLFSLLGLDRVALDLDLPKFLDTAAGRVLDFVKADNAQSIELEKIRTARALGTAQLAAGVTPAGSAMPSLNLARYVPYVIGGVILLVIVKAAMGGRR